MSKYPVEIKANLDGAITNLQTARALLEAGQYETAATQAADAAFHTGSMLLLDEEIEPSQLGDVVTLIQQVFVQGRRLTKDQGSDLSWLFALRKAEKRGAAQVNSEEAGRAMEIAESFFEAAKVILDS